MASSTADLIKGAASTMAAGGSVDSNSVDSTNPGTTSRSQVSIEAEAVSAGESTLDDLLGTESDSTPEDQSATSEPASSKAKQSVPAKETITVTDDQGRRRKIEIDYNDRAAVKKAHEMMHGARKWQAERDQARSEVAKEKAAKAELQSNWQAMEQAFQKSGVAGVIDLLEGKEGAYKTWEQKAVQRARFLEDASPEQIQALQSQERAEQDRRELARIRKENEDFKKEMLETKDQADLSNLSSKITPVFDKYRFADKLGDATDEHMFDDMLWNTAMKRLEPYEAEYGDANKIPHEILEREFRAVAQAVRKRIGMQAEKKAAKVVAQKKQEATENVQTAVKSGYKTGGIAQEAKGLIDSRDLTGLLKNWGRLGGAFRK
jgi:hypothetical protein